MQKITKLAGAKTVILSIAKNIKPKMREKDEKN